MSPAQFLQFDIKRSVATEKVVSDILVMVAVFIWFVWLTGK